MEVHYCSHEKEIVIKYRIYMYIANLALLSFFLKKRHTYAPTGNSIELQCNATTNISKSRYTHELLILYHYQSIRQTRSRIIS